MDGSAEQMERVERMGNNRIGKQMGDMVFGGFSRPLSSSPLHLHLHHHLHPCFHLHLHSLRSPWLQLALPWVAGMSENLPNPSLLLQGNNDQRQQLC